MTTNRGKADQAYEILFPNVEGTALVPEPVKCPTCLREVNDVSEIQGQEGYQTCEKCRQEDASRADAGW